MEGYSGNFLKVSRNIMRFMLQLSESRHYRFDGNTAPVKIKKSKFLIEMHPFRNKWCLQIKRAV